MVFDPLALAYYALICGFLSLMAPAIGGTWPRLAIGAAVGIAAASVLPVLKGFFES